MTQMRVGKGWDGEVYKAPDMPKMKPEEEALLSRLVKTKITNPKTIRRYARSEGLNLDTMPTQDILDAVKIIDHKQRYRLQSQWGREPLEFKAYTRERRARELSRQREVLDAPISKSWHASFRKKVLEDARIGIDVADDEARLATIEAIVRNAKKEGWKERHKSISEGRASSRYLEHPQYGKVRLSDHELPDTEERRYNHATFGKAWNREIVVDDWQEATLADYLAWIKGPQKEAGKA